MYFNNFYARNYYTDTYWGLSGAVAAPDLGFGAYRGLYLGMYANIYESLY
jgi:hypothetical protein